MASSHRAYPDGQETNVARERTVRLLGGPHEGKVVPRPDSASLIVTGDCVPEGMCARYRRTRDRAVYRFDGWDRIVGSIPMPGGGDV